MVMLNRELAEDKIKHGMPIIYYVSNGELNMTLEGRKLTYDFVNKLKETGHIKIEGTIMQGKMTWQKKKCEPITIQSEERKKLINEKNKNGGYAEWQDGN